MEASELGAWLAVTWGGLGFLGTYLGGYLANRYAACRESIQMRGCSLVFAAVGLLYLGLFLSPDQHQAITFMAAAGMIGTMSNGVIFSAIQSLVSDRMRSVTLALIFLLANLIGLGFGPLVVGALSDLLAPAFGQESLRYALAAFAPGLAWVAIFYWKAANTIEADIRAIEPKVSAAASNKALADSNAYQQGENQKVLSLNQP